jgi:hypothetical protein
LIAVGAFAAGAGNTIFTAFWQTAATGIVASTIGSRDTLLGAAAISLLSICLALGVREIRDVRL